MRSIAILGSTGTIGVNALNVLRQFPKRFSVSGLVAGRRFKRLARQVIEFSPEMVSVQHEEDVPTLRKLIGRRNVEIL